MCSHVELFRKVSDVGTLAVGLVLSLGEFLLQRFKFTHSERTPTTIFRSKDPVLGSPSYSHPDPIPGTLANKLFVKVNLFETGSFFGLN